VREIDKKERLAVVKRPSVAKLLVSPTYTRVKKLYLREITKNIILEEYTQYEDADDIQVETSDEQEGSSEEGTDSGEEDQEGSETEQGTDSGSEYNSGSEGGDEAFD